MMGKYYKILGLKIGASFNEVQERYNHLIEEFNPEKQEDDLKDFFKKEQDSITKAYNKVLENIIEIKEESEKDEVILQVNKVEKEEIKNTNSKEIERCYKIFGLKKGSSLEEVEEKYKELLDEYNPEHQSDDLRGFFETEQERVKEAYNTIIKHLSEEAPEEQVNVLNEDEIHDLGTYQDNDDVKYCKFCGHMQYVTNSECVNCRESLFPVNNGNVVSNSNIVRSNNQKGMLILPFSFNGRIRRLEYSLSFIIFVVVFGFMIHFFEDGLDEGAAILLLPVFWFIIAQGAKRCHDMSLSGWMQLIPYFNPLALIFASGKIGDNKYGSNPKGLNYN